MTDQNATFTGSIPENYHKYLGPMIFHEFADDLSGRVPVTSGIRVLEVACGTGIVSERLLRRLARHGTLVATDLNEAMFGHAQRLGAGGPHVTWQQADGTSLPFASESFDAVVCQFGLMFFPDKPAGVREAHRVLKRGGRYYFNVWDALDRNPFARIAHETVGTFFPDDPPQFYTVPFCLYDPTPVKGWLEQAGFADVSVETVDKMGARMPASDAAIGLVEGNPLYLDIMNRRPHALFEIKTAVAKRLAAELGDPVRTPLRAHVFSARKP